MPESPLISLMSLLSRSKSSGVAPLIFDGLIVSSISKTDGEGRPLNHHLHLSSNHHQPVMTDDFVREMKQGGRRIAEST